MKSEMMDQLITMGAASVGIAKLAEQVSTDHFCSYFENVKLIKQFGVDLKSLYNALAPKKAGNMRGKAVSAVRK
jgi:hypothetical protein